MQFVGEALLTDLYQLTMAQAYFELGMRENAVFELFVRRLPETRRFLLAAGLEQALEYIEGLRFTADDIAFLATLGRFRTDFLDCLRSVRFTGAVHAMPEGSPFFANEPIVRVSAPILEAQLLERRLINIVHFQTTIASKAARCVIAARGTQLIDFGMRRAHEADAAVLAAPRISRASMQRQRWRRAAASACRLRARSHTPLSRRTTARSRRSAASC
jgi:nicotinate phosphoribosyltransferase